VLSSPFNQYLSGNLLFRDGKKSPASIELAIIEFEKTLSEIQQMGIIPVVFSPPPGNDSDLGRCLARAEWRGINLSKCDFGINKYSQTGLDAIKFLKKIEEHYSVIFINDLLCDESLCTTHIDNNIFVYRDFGHLSHEGSAALGKKHDFYRMIVEH